MVFDCFMPYLKGFHLTLAQHLSQMDEEGWKVSDAEWVSHLEHLVGKREITEEQEKNVYKVMSDTQVEPPPDLVSPVPCLW